MRSLLAPSLFLVSLVGFAADYPTPQEGSWVVRDFKFHTGEVLPELRLHYTTVGAPTGEPVLILHGTNGSGSGMLNPAIGTNGGNQALYKAAPTREKADALIASRFSAPFRGDANDHLYQWDSSRDYNPAPGLDRIQAVLLAINSADDERNPPELGVLEREMKRVKNGRIFLIPASEDTAGHGTTGRAKFWKDELAKVLESAPRRAQ